MVRTSEQIIDAVSLSGRSLTIDLHAVDIFTRFNALWVETNPRDVMAFPAIFQSLKDDIRSELVAQSFRY